MSEPLTATGPTSTAMAAVISGCVSMLSGIGTACGAILNFLDGHAAGIAALITILTYLTNIYFNAINRKELLTKAAEELADRMNND